MLPCVIIDTNVLVAATRNRVGPSFALFKAVRAQVVLMACTPALFLEYEDVLKRPEQLLASGLDQEDVDAILNELAGLLKPVQVHYHWKPQLRDPSDEMVLEAAVNAQSQAIVTYNVKDFFAAHRFGLQVMTPLQALQAFNLTHFRSIQP